MRQISRRMWPLSQPSRSHDRKATDERIPPGARQGRDARELAQAAVQRLELPECPSPAADGKYRGVQNPLAAGQFACPCRRRRVRGIWRQAKHIGRLAARDARQRPDRDASRAHRQRMVRARAGCNDTAYRVLGQQVADRRAWRYSRRQRSSRSEASGYGLRARNCTLGLWRLQRTPLARHDCRHFVRRRLCRSGRRRGPISLGCRMGRDTTRQNLTGLARISRAAKARRQKAWRYIPLCLNQYRSAWLGLRARGWARLFGFAERVSMDTDGRGS